MKEGRFCLLLSRGDLVQCKEMLENQQDPYVVDQLSCTVVEQLRILCREDDSKKNTIEYEAFVETLKQKQEQKTDSDHIYWLSHETENSDDPVCLYTPERIYNLFAKALLCNSKLTIRKLINNGAYISHQAFVLIKDKNILTPKELVSLHKIFDTDLYCSMIEKIEEDGTTPNQDGEAVKCFSSIPANFSKEVFVPPGREIFRPQQGILVEPNKIGDKLLFGGKKDIYSNWFTIKPSEFPADKMSKKSYVYSNQDKLTDSALRRRECPSFYFTTDEFVAKNDEYYLRKKYNIKGTTKNIFLEFFTLKDIRTKSMDQLINQVQKISKSKLESFFGGTNLLEEDICKLRKILINYIKNTLFDPFVTLEKREKLTKTQTEAPVFKRPSSEIDELVVDFRDPVKPFAYIHRVLQNDSSTPGIIPKFLDAGFFDQNIPVVFYLSKGYGASKDQKFVQIYKNQSISQQVGVYQNFDEFTAENNSLLADAVREADVNAINILLNYGANIDYIEPQLGKSLLEIAVENKQAPITDHLLSRGATITDSVLLLVDSSSEEVKGIIHKENKRGPSSIFNFFNAGTGDPPCGCSIQ